jgi:hypothetical protein
MLQLLCYADMEALDRTGQMVRPVRKHIFIFKQMARTTMPVPIHMNDQGGHPKRGLLKGMKHLLWDRRLRRLDGEPLR